MSTASRPPNFAAIERLGVSAYKIPTATPESDGTLEWNSTTLVLVKLPAAGVCGVGYSYADKASAVLIHEHFAELLRGKDAFATQARWQDMFTRVRNLGVDGIAAMAISAVDTALWDWKARFLNLPLVALFGAARDGIRVYGSGGFTSYDDAYLQKQLGGWVEQGMHAVKMKIGREPHRDPSRIHAARQAIGERAELFVDANGALTRKQALDVACTTLKEQRASWFEEPVSSEDLSGLHLLRDRAPPPIAISAGEYGYSAGYFRRMLQARAVDVLQADATRCGGFTGFMRAAALCEAFQIPLSSHCAPALHLHAMCAVPQAIHLEYFFDHVRIEQMLFDGVSEPQHGILKPDLSRPGLGLEFKQENATCYLI